MVSTSRTAEKAREVERQLLARERAVTETQAQADRLLENSRLEAEADAAGCTAASPGRPTSS